MDQIRFICANHKRNLLTRVFVIMGLLSLTQLAFAHERPVVATKDVVKRVEGKSFPAVFQAWNPIDMPEKYPLDKLSDRLKWASKHSLLWEEPVSQLGFNTELVLGLVWDHKHAGLATKFTKETLKAAKKNRKQLLKHNPHMVFLMEIRWRDAPGSYLPEDSEYWLRNDDGTRVMGWDGGPEPYYKLNFEKASFQKRIGEQARAAVDSGVYDGVMLDWSGHPAIVKEVREALEDNGLIIVNIHDDIEDGEKYKDYINGAFMECGPDTDRLCTWERMAEALLFYEKEFLRPRINALELWGDRKDLQAMRAVTTLGLTHSDGYVLFADRNKIPTPDHMHDWYDFWDVELGKPLGKMTKREDGAFSREFENGVVVYNPPYNKAVKIKFDDAKYAVSVGTSRQDFDIPKKDGEIFLHKKP